MMQALLDLVPCVLLSAQDTFRIAQQDIALRCAAQPLAGALKQRGSQLAFQIADGFGYALALRRKTTLKFCKSA